MPSCRCSQAVGVGAVGALVGASVGALVGAVGAVGHLEGGGLVFDRRVEGRIDADVGRHAGEDEPEGVGNEGGGGLGEAERPAEIRGEEALRGVVGDGEAGGDANDVFRARAPPRLIHLAADVLVQETVVHLLRRVLDEVGKEIAAHIPTIEEGGVTT